MLRGSSIGTTIGALPGAGGDMAAWVAYATAKKFSKTPEKFGTGHVEGIVESGSANNSGLSSAWVPALVFGIPGDAVTAIAIGVLYMKGMNPGPTVFMKNPSMLYAVFICFFLANLLLIPFGYMAIRLARRILAVPRNILMPIILLFCAVGSFAINNTVFGIGVMLVLGLIAYVMEINRFPIAPVILGIVMGPAARKELHDLDDHRRRQPARLFRAPHRRRPRRLRHHALGPARCGCACCANGSAPRRKSKFPSDIRLIGRDALGQGGGAFRFLAGHVVHAHAVAGHRQRA